MIDCACHERLIGPFQYVEHTAMKCVGYLHEVRPNWIATEEALSPRFFLTMEDARELVLNQLYEAEAERIKVCDVEANATACPDCIDLREEIKTLRNTFNGEEFRP